MTNMLDLNKFLAGKLGLNPELCSLVKDVVEHTHAMLRGNEHITLESSLPIGDALWVEADALRLKQVMVNLTKNAIKFTPEGRVTLGVRATSTPC